MLDAYTGHLTGGVVATPTSSLVTGYDFLQDAADAVATQPQGGYRHRRRHQERHPDHQPERGAERDDGERHARPHALVDRRRPPQVAVRTRAATTSSSWPVTSAPTTPWRPTTRPTSSRPSWRRRPTNFANAIVFSAGCHSGYNIVDGDAVPNVTQPLDWVQAFARKQATLIAGTGYQYGDTDFIAYSERIYAEFSRQLRITTNPAGTAQPVSVGNALVRSKRNYLKTTAAPLSGLDEKALLEATLFGLPMLSVNLPTGRIYAGPAATSVATPRLPRRRGERFPRAQDRGHGRAPTGLTLDLGAAQDRQQHECRSRTARSRVPDRPGRYRREADAADPAARQQERIGSRVRSGLRPQRHRIPRWRLRRQAERDVPLTARPGDRDPRCSRAVLHRRAVPAAALLRELLRRDSAAWPAVRSRAA